MIQDLPYGCDQVEGIRLSLKCVSMTGGECAAGSHCPVSRRRAGAKASKDYNLNLQIRKGRVFHRVCPSCLAISVATKGEVFTPTCHCNYGKKE